MSTLERHDPGSPAASAPRAQPGYLIVRVDASGAYLGALMIADHTGLPLDFRYTDPITPTRLQRALYGGVLDRHLRGQVVLRTLLAAADHAPTLLVVDDRELLTEPGLPCEAVMLGASAAAPIGDPGTTHSQGAGSCLLQVSADEAPVRVTLAAGTPAEAERAVLDALTAIGATMDLLEPLERVRDALELIAAGEVEPDGP